MAALRLFCNYFWLWTVLGAVAAWFFPQGFIWFVAEKIPGTEVKIVTAGLGVIMLGMGLTLTLDDFKSVLKTPWLVLCGVLAQFFIMPLLGCGIASMLNVDTQVKIGIILVSCCPGGTASNVICYLARANVALSVLMTMCSTLAAVLATPFLTKTFASRILDVDAWAMVQSMLVVVVVPVVAGVVINHFFRKRLTVVKQVSPVFSVIVIVMIVSGIIGARKEAIVEYAYSLLPAMFILHALGFGIAYGIAKLLKQPEQNARTLSIEVGMQNSGLGATLAKAHFSGLAATPCAISAFYHCIIGAVLAGIWRVKKPKEMDTTQDSV